MPLFEYTTFDERGGPQTGLLEARDIVALKRILFERSILTTKIRPLEAKRSLKVLSLNHSATITRQIALFLKTGLTLDAAFFAMAQSCRNREIQKKLFWVAHQLTEGSRLEEALKGIHLFPLFFVRVISVAEKTGRLPEVLDNLASHCERKDQLLQHWIQGLLYPGLLFIVSLGVLAFVFCWVFPSFLDLFSQMDRPLPKSTKIILSIGEWLSNYGWLFLVLGLGVSVGWMKFQHFKYGRKFLPGFLMRLPGVQWIWKKKNACEISQNMALLLKGGFQIPESFSLAGHAQPLIQEELLKFRLHLEEGKGVESGKMLEKIFPREFIIMLSVAFKSGHLAESCERMALSYQHELDHFFTRFTTLLGPVLLLGVGVLIGVLAVGVLLPIFEYSFTP